MSGNMGAIVVEDELCALLAVLGQNTPAQLMAQIGTLRDEFNRLRDGVQALLDQVLGLEPLIATLCDTATKIGFIGALSDESGDVAGI